MSCPFLTDTAIGVEGMAHWRRKMANQHPNDPRHSAAAARLDRIAAELYGLKKSDVFGSDLHLKIGALWEQALARDPAPFLDAESEVEEGIGFDSFPETASDFLRLFIARVEQGAAGDGSAATPAQPTGARQ